MKITLTKTMCGEQILRMLGFLPKVELRSLEVSSSEAGVSFQTTSVTAVIPWEEWGLMTTHFDGKLRSLFQRVCCRSVQAQEYVGALLEQNLVVNSPDVIELMNRLETLCHEFDHHRLQRMDLSDRELVARIIRELTNCMIRLNSTVDAGCSQLLEHYEYMGGSIPEAPGKSVQALTAEVRDVAEGLFTHLMNRQPPDRKALIGQHLCSALTQLQHVKNLSEDKILTPDGYMLPSEVAEIYPMGIYRIEG